MFWKCWWHWLWRNRFTWREHGSWRMSPAWPQGSIATHLWRHSQLENRHIEIYMYICMYACMLYIHIYDATYLYDSICSISVAYALSLYAKLLSTKALLTPRDITRVRCLSLAMDLRPRPADCILELNGAILVVLWVTRCDPLKTSTF